MKNNLRTQTLVVNSQNIVVATPEIAGRTPIKGNLTEVRTTRGEASPIKVGQKVIIWENGNTQSAYSAKHAGDIIKTEIFLDKIRNPNSIEITITDTCGRAANYDTNCNEFLNSQNQEQARRALSRHWLSGNIDRK